MRQQAARQRADGRAAPLPAAASAAPGMQRVHIDSSCPVFKCREEHCHLFRLTMYKVWLCLETAGLETAVFLSLDSEYVAIRDAGDSGCVVGS